MSWLFKLLTLNWLLSWPLIFMHILYAVVQKEHLSFIPSLVTYLTPNYVKYNSMIFLSNSSMTHARMHVCYPISTWGTVVYNTQRPLHHDSDHRDSFTASIASYDIPLSLILIIFTFDVSKFNTHFSGLLLTFSWPNY